MNAHTIVGFQESGFAEATDDAVLGADPTRVWVGAGGWAGGSASVENFVLFALRNFWWISEELHSFRGLAFTSWHAHATSISQKTFIAEASDDAVLGANRAWIRVGAGGGASGTTWIEEFGGWAFRCGLGKLHGDFVVTSVTF